MPLDCMYKEPHRRTPSLPAPRPFQQQSTSSPPLPYPSPYPPFPPPPSTPPTPHPPSLPPSSSLETRPHGHTRPSGAASRCRLGAARSLAGCVGGGGAGRCRLAGKEWLVGLGTRR